MKFNLKEKLASADDDILAEVIDACEKKMTSKFKPKEDVAVVEVEDKPDVEKEDLPDADLEDLLEIYGKLKG